MQLTFGIDSIFHYPQSLYRLQKGSIGRLLDLNNIVGVLGDNAGRWLALPLIHQGTANELLILEYWYDRFTEPSASTVSIRFLRVNREGSVVRLTWVCGC